MRASLYGFSASSMFRLLLWVGIFLGIMIQFFFPIIGWSIVEICRATILGLAQLIR